MKDPGRYSLGIGDRFGHQAKAQLKAIQEAWNMGCEIIPVWNKSYREHEMIGSTPAETRIAVEKVVRELQWTKPYYVDADHINLQSVELFMDHCDFFTIDVADFIGSRPSSQEKKKFIESARFLVGPLEIPGIPQKINISQSFLEEMADKYVNALAEAKRIYQKIEQAKGYGQFISELSLDETADAQGPIELFFILYMTRDLPLNTIAPKFTGHFYKGIDYIGDTALFARDLEQLFLVLEHAKNEFNLYEGLKLSMHSGSDKFRIYPVINKLIKKHHQGIHIKTAGTTWIEELIGLARSGKEGLSLAKEIYSRAYAEQNSLIASYKNVVSIGPDQLPSPSDVIQWDSKHFCASLEHDPGNPAYNPGFRQLIHLAYKIAAQCGSRYHEAIGEHSKITGKHVCHNLFERHIKRIFL